MHSGGVICSVAMLQIAMIARSNWRSRWIVMARCIQSMVMHVLMCVGLRALLAYTLYWLLRCRIDCVITCFNYTLLGRYGINWELFPYRGRSYHSHVLQHRWNAINDSFAKKKYLEVLLHTIFAKHGRGTFGKNCDQRVHVCNGHKYLLVYWQGFLLICSQCKLLNANM